MSVREYGIGGDRDYLVVRNSDHRSKCIGSLLFDASSSDMTFVIAGEKIRAHRAIVASSSPFFRALLYDESRESNPEEVTLENVSSEEFKLLLGYIYSGVLKLARSDHQLVLKVLALADSYGLRRLLRNFDDRLQLSLSAVNVFSIFHAADLHGLGRLRRRCSSFINETSRGILLSKSFRKLEARDLGVLLSRDALCAKEIDILKAVIGWCSESSNEAERADILKRIRLHLIPLKELLGFVSDLELIGSDHIFAAARIRMTQFRDVGPNSREEIHYSFGNVATVKTGASVITGSPATSCIFDPEEGRVNSWDTGCSKCRIGDGIGITVDLGKAYYINHIMMRLWAMDNRAFSYYIEVSLYRKDWQRIIDMTQSYRKSIQRLYFDTTFARYIRVLGTRCTVDNDFSIVTFQASYAGER